VKNKASKDRCQGVTLWEALVLKEEICGAVWGCKVTAISRSVHQIKIGEEGLEMGLCGKGSLRGIARDFFEHVDNVHEQKGTVGGLAGFNRAIDILMELRLHRV
jgi:hypothetical protein